MKDTNEISGKDSKFRRWSPPTLTLVMVFLLAVVLLPSALNIPQSNPNTVLEYAPVPPDEESQTAEQGNLAALGQAQGSSQAQGGREEPPLPIPAGGQGGQKRTGKKCVGNPPRQTEDLMSPPCVSFFEGNNGGATYQGVTRDEIVVVIYHDYAQSPNTGDGVEGTPPSGSYCDIDLPENSGGVSCWAKDSQRDHAYVRWARAFSRYFNDRYQTYNRHVHFWSYFDSGFTVETKRSVAGEHYTKLKPFAALDQTIFSGNDDAYLDAMARRGVMIFRGGFTFDYQPASLFQKYAPLVWDFMPDVEHRAEQHISYLCTKIAGNPVSHTTGRFATGLPMRGSPRKYAFMSPGFPGVPGWELFAKIVKNGVRTRCGIDGMDLFYDFVEEGAQNVAQMKSENVTTVLTLGGVDFNGANAGEAARYYPEVIYAGNGQLEIGATPRVNGPRNWWSNAAVVTSVIRYDTIESDSRYAACKEGNPSLSKASCSYGAQFQRDYFMLFGAIQAAGPRLSPKAVDRGFHAIPAIRSNSPFLASCFFEPGDYTCVKDAMQEWYDPDRPAPGTNQPGCWRMIQGGKRFLANHWDPGDDVFPNSTDICNSYGDGSGGVFEPQP